MNDSLKERLVSVFEGIRVDLPEEDRVVITAEKEAVLSVLSFLKSGGFEHLGLVSCVDWIEDNAFELVYVLSAYMREDGAYSDNDKVNVILKTRIARERPVFISAVPVFANAEPYEREIHELYGVRFEGHPRLTPLFLEREYKTPPFRKDFDTRRYVEEFFDSIPAVEKKDMGT